MDVQSATPGPYTVWLDYGSEGWHPHECDTLAECFDQMRSFGHSGDYRITRDVHIEIREAAAPAPPALWKRTDCPACVRDAERRRIGDEMECPGHPTSTDGADFLRNPKAYR
ncbi:hypothetical protein [Mycolicibacterium goodii]|uniref:hypothetical protein n=1 Tax=Mycolicibacterium goodii TaxID=134601 RepID=UPI001BDC8A56|nr:hypothetical protein [Mycolicibacterium goodii]MBU8834141.1 hypothetical protein [Mycolicibacterium goodii]